MDQFEVATSGGVFGFVGRIHCDRMRPTLLAVNGSFPDKTYLHDLVERFPGAQVLVAHLPGMGPPWSPTSLERLTEGLGEATHRLAGDSPLVVYGVSTGNLLGLGLRSPNIVRKIASEPFFRTADLLPFISFCRKLLDAGTMEEAQKSYIKTLFGIEADGSVSDIDYRYIVKSIVEPADFILGAELLPTWSPDAPKWPSLTSEADRELIYSIPGARIYIGDPGTGHSVSVYGRGKQLAESLIHKALLEASKLCS